MKKNDEDVLVCYICDVELTDDEVEMLGRTCWDCHDNNKQIK